MTSVNDSERRRFTLFDAMLMVAVTAVAFAPARFGLSRPYFDNPLATRYWIAPVRARTAELTVILLAWTLALLALRFLGPRPRLARLARQPGMAACYAAALGFGIRLFGVACSVPEMVKVPKMPSFSWPAWWYTSVFGTCAHAAAWCVLTAWLTLRLSGRRGPDRDWIGRTGHALGWCWVALSVANTLPPF